MLERFNSAIGGALLRWLLCKVAQPSEEIPIKKEGLRGRIINNTSKFKILYLLVATTLTVIFEISHNNPGYPFIFCDEDLLRAVAIDINTTIIRTVNLLISSGAVFSYRLLPSFSLENFPSLPFFIQNIFLTSLIIFFFSEQFVKSLNLRLALVVVFFLNPYLISNMSYIYQDQGALLYILLFYVSLYHFMGARSPLLLLSIGIWSGALFASKPHFLVFWMSFIYIQIHDLVRSQINYFEFFKNMTLGGFGFVLGVSIFAPEWMIQILVLPKMFFYNVTVIREASILNVGGNFFGMLLLATLAFTPVILLLMVRIFSGNHRNLFNQSLWVGFFSYLLALSPSSVILFRDFVILVPVVWLIILSEMKCASRNLVLVIVLLLCSFLHVSWSMLEKNFVGVDSRRLLTKFVEMEADSRQLKTIYVNSHCEVPGFLFESSDVSYFSDESELSFQLDAVPSGVAVVISDWWYDRRNFKASGFLDLVGDDWRDMHYNYYSWGHTSLNSFSRRPADGLLANEIRFSGENISGPGLSIFLPKEK